MIGRILQQLLADPGLAQAHRIGDEHAVVAGQDAARLLDGILLEAGQFHRRADARQRQPVAAQFVAEVLVERLEVDLVGRVLVSAELRFVQQRDEVGLEVAGFAPAGVVPVQQLQDGPRADLALDLAAGVEFHASGVRWLSEEGQIGAVSGGGEDGPDGLGGLGVRDLLRRQQHLVGEVELLVGGQPGAGEVAGADDARHGPEAVAGRAVGEAEVALGVQEAALVEPHGDALPAQEADQRLDQLQRGLVEGGRVEVAAQGLPQAQVAGPAWLRAEQQAHRSQALQHRLQELEGAHVEVGGGDVERVDGVAAQQVVEHDSQPVLAVINDVGEFQARCSNHVTQPSKCGQAARIVAKSMSIAINEPASSF